jgi:hypothetical protein
LIIKSILIKFKYQIDKKLDRICEILNHNEENGLSENISEEFTIIGDIEGFEFFKFEKICDKIEVDTKFKFSLLGKRILFQILINRKMTPSKLSEILDRKRPTLYDHFKKMMKYNFVKNKSEQINDKGRPNIFWYLDKKFISYFNKYRFMEL